MHGDKVGVRSLPDFERENPSDAYFFQIKKHTKSHAVNRIETFFRINTIGVKFVRRVHPIFFSVSMIKLVRRPSSQYLNLNGASRFGFGVPGSGSGVAALGVLVCSRIGLRQWEFL